MEPMQHENQYIVIPDIAMNDKTKIQEEDKIKRDKATYFDLTFIMQFFLVGKIGAIIK